MTTTNSSKQLTTQEKGANLSRVQQTILKLDGATLIKIEDCFDKDFLSLRVLATKENMFELKAFLSKEMIAVNRFLNLGEPMSIAQIETTCTMVLQEFLTLNVADIKLCFQMGMAGRFGKLYNRIDGQIILGWLREYQEQRFEVAECIELQKGAMNKNQQPITIADAKKMYEDYKARQPIEDEQDAEQRDKDQHQKLFQARLELAQAEIDKIPAPNFNGMSKEEVEKAQADHKNQRFEILKKYGVV